jgi:hypothetical protein
MGVSYVAFGPESGADLDPAANDYCGTAIPLNEAILLRSTAVIIAVSIIRSAANTKPHSAGAHHAMISLIAL